MGFKTVYCVHVILTQVVNANGEENIVSEEILMEANDAKLGDLVPMGIGGEGKITSIGTEIFKYAIFEENAEEEKKKD